MAQDRIVAIGLLTRSDLERLGGTFVRLWPIDDAPCFDELLAAIDEADQHPQDDKRHRLTENGR